MKKILPFFVAILLLSNSLFGQLPLTGLLAWYPFCDNANDQSPAALYGLANTGVTFTTDRFGSPVTTAQFNGASSLFFAVPFFNAAGFSSSDFTYSCWFYAVGAQSSIIWYNGDPQTNGYGIYMNNGTLGTAGTNVEIVFGGAIGQYLSTPVTLSAWHHLLFTKYGGAFTLYIDGTTAGTFIPSPTFVTPTLGQFTIGQDYTTGNSSFNGDIDDMAIYNISLATTQRDSLNTFDPDIAPFTFGTSGSDTTICSNTITLIPTLPYETSYTYNWNTGATTTSITVTPAVSPGTDYLLTVTQLYGCSYTSSIDVSHLNVFVHIGPRDTTFCVSGTATLNPTPVAGETYLWSNGDTTGSIAVSGSGTYWVLVDSADGCTGRDTTTIIVQPAVIVTLGNDTSSCQGLPITIQSSYVYGTGTGVTYQWGWDSTLVAISGITTQQTYSVTETGTYWLTETIGACTGSDTQVVNIVFDTLTILTPDTAICKSGSTGAVQIVGFGNPFAIYQWTPTAGLSSANSVNPFITPDTSAMYTVTATLLGCTTAHSLFIDVQPKPTVYLGGNRNVCKGDTIHITASVSPSWYTHYIYNWSPGINLDDSATTAGDSIVSTVVFTAGDSTDLIIIVKTPLDSTGRFCRAVDSAEIMVHTPKNTVLRDTSICPGDSLILNPNPVPGDSYVWHSSVYLNDSTAIQPVAKPITSISYWTKSTDQFGCLDTATEKITVYPGAVIDLGDSVVLYPGESYQISPQTNCVFFSWQPPLGLSDTSIANPVASPKVNTKFIVHAATEYGCNVIDSINIDVTPSSLVALPNAFTPGSSVNNYLYILKRGIVTLNYFRIFNRWGTKVYESSNIDAGWDGTFNGKPQPFDVYVYELQAVTNQGVVFQKTGNVTLIR